MADGVGGGAHVVGVDFGAQTCRAYAWQRGRLVQVPSGVSRSVVALVEHLVAGRAGEKQLETRHPNAARHLLSGLTLRRPVLLEHPDGGARAFEADELAAFVLRRQRADCTAFLGGNVHRCVLPMAAATSSSQRRRVVAAGVAAGYRRVHIVPAPAAAAVYWAHCSGAVGSTRLDTRLLVVDVGCRSASAAVVHIRRGATTRDVRVDVVKARGVPVGGYDVDVALAGRMCDGAATTPTPGSGGPAHPVLAVNAAEAAKKDLASLQAATFAVRGTTRTVSRADLDAAAARLTNPVCAFIRTLVLEHPDVRLGVLVGGGSRLRAVQSYARACGLDVDVLDADYAGVMGAAIIASGSLRVHISESSPPWEYWAVDCMADGSGSAPRRLFHRCRSDTLPLLRHSSDAWCVLQRLKRTHPQAPPTRQALMAVAGLQSRGGRAPARPRADGVCDAGGDALFAPEACQPQAHTVTLNIEVPPTVRAADGQEGPDVRLWGLVFREAPPVPCPGGGTRPRLVLYTVAPDSPADRAGATQRRGWLLAAVNGRAVPGRAALAALGRECVGQAVEVALQAPEDYEGGGSPWVVVGWTRGGAVVLHTQSGYASGVEVEHIPVFEPGGLAAIKATLDAEDERAAMTKALGAVRCQLEEAVLRAEDEGGAREAGFAARLAAAADVLTSETTLDRDRRAAELQLAYVEAHAEYLLAALEGKALGGMDAACRSAAEALAAHRADRDAQLAAGGPAGGILTPDVATPLSGAALCTSFALPRTVRPSVSPVGSPHHADGGTPELSWMSSPSFSAAPGSMGSPQLFPTLASPQTTWAAPPSEVAEGSQAELSHAFSTSLASMCGTPRRGRSHLVVSSTPSGVEIFDSLCGAEAFAFGLPRGLREKKASVVAGAVKSPATPQLHIHQVASTYYQSPKTPLMHERSPSSPQVWTAQRGLRHRLRDASPDGSMDAAGSGAASTGSIEGCQAAISLGSSDDVCASPPVAPVLQAPPAVRRRMPLVPRVATLAHPRSRSPPRVRTASQHRPHRASRRSVTGEHPPVAEHLGEMPTTHPVRTPARRRSDLPRPPPPARRPDAGSPMRRRADAARPQALHRSPPTPAAVREAADSGVSPRVVSSPASARSPATAWARRGAETPRHTSPNSVRRRLGELPAPSAFAGLSPVRRRSGELPATSEFAGLSPVRRRSGELPAPKVGGPPSPASMRRRRSGELHANPFEGLLFAPSARRRSVTCENNPAAAPAGSVAPSGSPTGTRPARRTSRAARRPSPFLRRQSPPLYREQKQGKPAAGSGSRAPPPPALVADITHGPPRHVKSREAGVSS